MRVDYPWGVALSRVVSIPGILQIGAGSHVLHLSHEYFTSQVTPYWYWEYDLEASFLFSLLLF